MSDIELPIFVVYERPKDLPHAAFVVRQWTITMDGREPTPNTKHMEFATLEDARASIPSRCFRIPHQPDEDPVIVETWI